jgi:hypothetical protein
MVSRSVRLCHDPGLSFIPEADDKYAVMLREALPAKVYLRHFNFILLFHINRGDQKVWLWSLTLQGVDRVMEAIQEAGLIPNSYTWEHLLRYHGLFMKDMTKCLDIFDSLPPFYQRDAFIVTTMLKVAANLGLEFNYTRFKTLCEESIAVSGHSRIRIQESMIYAARAIGDQSKSEEVRTNSKRKGHA